MATMITGECINCGACEPECPNNAISQGEDIYVIDPLLCTECVGFHDYEACAAVCPVDCCVTDPNNVEGEEALIARARAIHQDVTFDENFESRFRKVAPKAEPAASQASAQKPAGEGKAASAESAAVKVAELQNSEAKKSEEKLSQAAPRSAPESDAKPAPPKPAPAVAPKTVRPEKRFPGEVAAGFKETLLKFENRGPLSKPVPRLMMFLAQPLLGALPHAFKKDLEQAVGDPGFFSAAGSTGLNVLFNMILYPLIFMALAVALNGPDVLFSQKINTYLLVGLTLGFLEAAYRLREGLFHAKSVAEMTFGVAAYGAPLAYVLQPLLSGQAGVIRHAPIPVDGFYEKGFVEKLERERRYGNVYTLQDWGGAYFLRLEFPRKVPDIGLPVRSKLPDEMPDYDYDLILKDGHFVVKGRCTDQKVRSISSSVGAFPPEFTTVIALQDKVHGFSHRYENKLLEVLLLKKGD
jgi:ferredoxin